MARSRALAARWRGPGPEPADLGVCGWLEAAPPPPPARVLEGAERADCAVLGAGFTGLAAARRLAELRPRWRIVVLEAQRAGDGASGRSSGFVVDAAAFIAAKVAPEADRFVRLSRAGIAALERLVGELAIDCDWDRRGWIHAAAGDAGFRSLDALQGWLERTGVSFDDLDRHALRQRLGTAHYRRGLLLPGSVQVQAGKLVRGLASALPAGVELFERSAVRGIAARAGSREHEVATAHGMVRTPRLVVALNAWMPRLGLLRQRLFPLLTYGSLTRPLTPEEQREAGEAAWGVLAQDPTGPSVRRTVDHRLLIRSRARYDPAIRASPTHLAAARARHGTELARRFPSLTGVGLETTWAGAMGTVPNQTPFFGRLGTDAVGAAGFTGAGIAMGTALGARAADLLCGEDHPGVADALALERPRWLPPEPFRSLGIRMQVARMNAGAAG